MRPINGRHHIWWRTKFHKVTTELEEAISDTLGENTAEGLPTMVPDESRGRVRVRAGMGEGLGFGLGLVQLQVVLTKQGLQCQ